MELTALRIAMDRAGLNKSELAALPAMNGFNAHRIKNVLCGQDTTWPIRAAINRALRVRIFEKPPTKHRKPKPTL